MNSQYKLKRNAELFALCMTVGAFWWGTFLLTGVALTFAAMSYASSFIIILKPSLEVLVQAGLIAVTALVCTSLIMLRFWSYDYGWRTLKVDKFVALTMLVQLLGAFSIALQDHMIWNKVSWGMIMGTLSVLALANLLYLIRRRYF